MAEKMDGYPTGALRRRLFSECLLDPSRSDGTTIQLSLKEARPRPQEVSLGAILRWLVCTQVALTALLTKKGKNAMQCNAINAMQCNGKRPGAHLRVGREKEPPHEQLEAARALGLDLHCMPRTSNSMAANQNMLDAIEAMMTKNLDDFQAKQNVANQQLATQVQSLGTQTAQLQAGTVGLRRKLGQLTNEVAGGSNNKQGGADALKQATKRHKKDVRKGIKLTNVSSPDMLQKLSDILRTHQKELAAAAVYFFFEHLVDSNILATVSDMLEMLLEAVLVKLELADESFSSEGAAEFVQFAMEDAAVVQAAKNLMTCALTNSLLKQAKVRVLEECGFDAAVKPTEQDMGVVLTLRGMEGDAEERSVGVLDGSGCDTTTLDENLREVVQLELNICKVADVHALSRSELFGVATRNDELFDFFNEENALAKAAKATYEKFADAGTSTTPEVAYENIEPKQRVNLLVLMTAVAMSGVNVVEQKKRGTSDERELVWAPNFSHSQLATSVLRGVFEFMMDEDLCPTTNADIVEVRSEQ